MRLLISIICIAFLSGFCSSYPANSCNDTQLENVIDDQNTIITCQNARIGSKVCMRELGCFEITPDFFDAFNRPINFLPRDRITIDTKFYLYTKTYPKESHRIQVSDLEDIKNSAFDPKHPTKFIVHGFWDSTFYGKWMETLKDNLLLYNDYNVIIVDWSRGNGAPYTQATANARVVGAEIALMITTLEKVKGISPMNCHIIGHSLGAHIAGYAGERLNKLNRISAVDPAEPYFQNMPPSVRLDPTDADFVDVIHSDSKSIKFLGLGMSQTIGHVDFFPNNGRDQPGCTTEPYRSIFTDGLVEATRRFLSCNHQRAVDFFTYSINYKRAPPVGYECPSWQDYLKGKCAECGANGSKCAIMGVRADEYRLHKNDSKSLKVYLSTSGSAPFWVSSYQISVKLYKPKTEFQDRKGKLYLTIHGSKNDYAARLTPSSIDLYHGATLPFLITTTDDLGDIKSLTFTWETASWTIFRTHTIFLQYIKVVPMNVIDYNERNVVVKYFCDKPNSAVKSKQSTSLNNMNCY